MEAEDIVEDEDIMEEVVEVEEGVAKAIGKKYVATLQIQSLLSWKIIIQVSHLRYFVRLKEL